MGRRPVADAAHGPWRGRARRTILRVQRADASPTIPRSPGRSRPLYQGKAGARGGGAPRRRRFNGTPRDPMTIMPAPGWMSRDPSRSRSVLPRPVGPYDEHGALSLVGDSLADAAEGLERA